MRLILLTLFARPLNRWSLALLSFTLLTTEALAQFVPSPEQRRDAAITAILRGCGLEANLLASLLTQESNRAFPEAVLETTLERVSAAYDHPDPGERINALQRVIANLHSSRRASAPGFSPNESAYPLLEHCALQERMKIERAPGFMAAPNTSTRVYKPAEFPGGRGTTDPTVSRLGSCVDFELVQSAFLRVTNRCAESVLVVGCVAEYQCGRKNFEVLLVRDSSYSYLMRRGLANTVYTWLCPVSSGGMFNPAAQTASCAR